MSERSEVRTYAIPLEALERSARVPRDDQVEEQADRAGHAPSWDWDEERRESRLAGGG